MYARAWRRGERRRKGTRRKNDIGEPGVGGDTPEEGGGERSDGTAGYYGIGIPEMYRNVRRNYVRLGGTRLPTISQLCYAEDGDGEKGRAKDGETTKHSAIVVFCFVLLLYIYFWVFFYTFFFFYQKLRIQNSLVCLLLRDFAARKCT